MSVFTTKYTSNTTSSYKPSLRNISPMCGYTPKNIIYVFLQVGSILGKSVFGDLHYAKIDLHSKISLHKVNI